MVVPTAFSWADIPVVVFVWHTLLLSGISLDVDDEHQGVVFLNLLHRALRVQRPGAGS